MVDIDNVEPHLFRKKRIVFGKFFHLPDQSAEHRFYLNRIFFFIFEILNSYDNRFFLVDNFADFEPLQG